MQPGCSWHANLQAIAGIWRNWRERRRNQAWFDHLDAQEASEVARELGLSVTELRTLVGQDRTSADLLQRRLQSLGIAASRVEPAVMRDLQRCCSQCDDKALCAHELEDGPREANWPRYCPNEQTIRALKARP